MICFNRKNNLNKINSMVKVDIIKNVKIAEIILENIYNTFLQSRSRI